jgi:hypothetical protein
MDNISTQVMPVVVDESTGVRRLLLKYADIAKSGGAFYTVPLTRSLTRSFTHTLTHPSTHY